jgi:toxin ParE1/3/4
MKPARLAPEAVTELADATVWYESRGSGLARKFLQEFETILRLIESRPASFPRLLDTSAELNIRRALLPRFPYASIFIELPSEIRIAAVAHVKRSPGYWLNRIRR